MARAAKNTKLSPSIGGSLSLAAPEYRGAESYIVDLFGAAVQSERSKSSALMWQTVGEVVQRHYELERQSLELAHQQAQRGQLFGLIIGIVALAGGVLTTILGAPIPGGIIGTGGVVGLVSVFVLSKRQSKT